VGQTPLQQKQNGGGIPMDGWIVVLDTQQANHQRMCEANHFEDKSLKVASDIEREWYGFHSNATGSRGTSIS
jgi:hypothetical protein